MNLLIQDKTEQFSMPNLNFSISQMINQATLKQQQQSTTEFLTPSKHRSMEQLLKSPGVQELIKDSIKAVIKKKDFSPKLFTQYKYDQLERSESPAQQILPKIEKINNIHVLKQIQHIKKKKSNNQGNSPKSKKSNHLKYQQGRFMQIFPQTDGISTLNISSKPIHIIQRNKFQDSFLNNSMDNKLEKEIVQKIRLQMEKHATQIESETVRTTKQTRQNSQLMKTSRNIKIEPMGNVPTVIQVTNPNSTTTQLPSIKKKKLKKFDGIYYFDPKYPQDLIFQERYASMRHYFNIMNLSNCLFVQPTQNIYKAYVGKGNNGMLVRQIIKSRWWWSIQDEQEQCHFVWTQLKVNTIHENMKALNRNPNESMSCQSASSSLTTIGSVSLGFSKQDEQSESEQIKVDAIQKINNQWSKFLANAELRQFSTILNGQGRQSKLLTLEQAQTVKPKLSVYNEPVKAHNHLENNFHLGNKKALFYNMKAYYESQNLNVFENLPVTYHIKSLDGPEYHQFMEAYKERQQMINQENDEKNKRRNIWIIKPGEITNRGNGIKVSEDLNEIQSILNSREMHKNGSYKTFIVQLYIDRPLLYNKRKFDIRCYSMYVSINGNQKGYWYTEGYVRTSSKEFTMKNLTNKMIHLTNDAVQKKGEDYGKYEKGNKVSFEEFSVYVENLGGDFNKIYAKMKQMATEQFKAVYGKIDQNKRENTFEIFGLDFMIDDTFNVKMIEANTNPSIEICCPLLSKLIPQMLDNAFKIALDPIFPPPNFYNPKKIICENYLDNKFELVFDEMTDGSLITQSQPNYDIGLIEEESEEEEPE
ncbi:unnamed protein product [Paramecium primaurelia]|uniref:Tubulin-tyrosine ligase family protein n=1 Tax=Paramecium primaurelia TaxID=5886 RepID=A0A8S1P676_PARPR|nr:unnamed protein product [Paramecium primaurelia]